MNSNEDTNKFTFTCEHPDGTINTLDCTALTWTKAIHHFVDFLRGAGYLIQSDDVKVPKSLLNEGKLFNLEEYQKYNFPIQQPEKEY